MLIRFLGHACFELTLDDGRSLLIDPYEPNGLGGKLRYQPVAVAPDWVLITHEHRDHCDLSWVGGRAEPIRSDLTAPGLSVTALHAFHDEHGGRLRGGRTRMFIIEADGQRIAHVGDLGERLSAGRCDDFGQLDALLVPTGGYFTLGPAGAAALVALVAPKYAVPCHYRTADADIEELLPVERFAARFEGEGNAGRVTKADALDLSVDPVTRPTVVILNAHGASETKQ